MGIVTYQGVTYEGKHEALIDPELWLRVQDVLAVHAHAGDKNRKHTHYLRGTIFCGECGSRLVFSRNKGNGGYYDYFVCVKKRTRSHNCPRPAIRLEKVEDGIAAFYARPERPRGARTRRRVQDTGRNAPAAPGRPGAARRTGRRHRWWDNEKPRQ